MNRIGIETRGINSWRERLANPDKHWKRRYSAFETAVSWETASRTVSGLPAPIERLLVAGGFLDPTLLIALAEHKVDLPGGAASSQSDVWALVRTSAGIASIAVEAKAQEAFGDDALDSWLLAGQTDDAKTNRALRWDHVRSHLPIAQSYTRVRYQMLHRCAAAVIEAKRFGLKHAAFIVQAFGSPETSFEDYAIFCDALGIPAGRGSFAVSQVDDIVLGIGWADCAFATDREIAAVA